MGYISSHFILPWAWCLSGYVSYILYVATLYIAMGIVSPWICEYYFPTFLCHEHDSTWICMLYKFLLCFAMGLILTHICVLCEFLLNYAMSMLSPGIRVLYKSIPYFGMSMLYVIYVLTLLCFTRNSVGNDKEIYNIGMVQVLP